MMNLPGRLARLEARAQPTPTPTAPHVLTDAELEAHVRALIAAGLLWLDETGTWHATPGDDAPTDAHGYTRSERAGMLAEMMNRLQDQNKEGETNV